jgi:CMP-N,N'-diacetyllegionaminic acid synthase
MIVGIIPARGGSKRIKNKNICKIGKFPLIYFTILASQKSKIGKTYVSTNCQKIAEVANQYGAEIIIRPDELAKDTSSSEDALIHSVLEIEKQNKVEKVVMLQPTSPFRNSNHINEALSLSENYDSIISVSKDIRYYFSGVVKNGVFISDYDLSKRLRTQEISPKYVDNGSIYIMSRNQIVDNRCRFGGRVGAYIMSDEASIDIDDEEDLNYARWVYEHSGFSNDLPQV